MTTVRVASRVVPHYRPGEPHGWPPAGATLGGNVRDDHFLHNGRSYRIELHGPDPEYAAAPTVDFVHTVEAAFGARYSFRYAGGLPDRDAFSVRSYSVTVSGPPLSYGADLYVVYDGDPEPAQALRWIQVVRRSGFGSAAGFVDNGGRANPFLPTGGPTSVHGHRLVNLYTASLTTPPDDAPDLTGDHTAEVFLAHDTGIRDRSGHDAVVVTGGLRYGWRVHQT